LGSTGHSFFSIFNLRFKSLDSKEESMQRKRAVQGSWTVRKKVCKGKGQFRAVLLILKEDTSLQRDRL
jgi:hypothetical protein